MNEQTGGAIEQLPLAQYTESAYLNYAMYVINDRALPHIGDGLKPVQRRIVYAMSELRLAADAKFAKSARTIGDVIGKFHPHGDSACYEAMVLMAQPFSYRHPLVDGQGNWGSPDDPKSYAAMRYTESKLTQYAELLLGELPQGTVDWAANFDGTLEEPLTLPARVPNILLNGASGIAVGMATDILPHNLRELTAACIALLDKPGATLEDVCEHVQGPDFPTGGEIVSSREEIQQLYATGKGAVRVRARIEEEGEDLVITELPYQVSGAKVQEQIAAQMQAKKLPMVVDLRDESDHESPTRIVITPRSNRVDRQALMGHLFATTDLMRSCRVNFNMIGTDGRPQVKPLLALLREWLRYRQDTVLRRLKHRLEKLLDRLHILEGLMTAYLNIEAVIQLIRTEEKPKQALMARFELSERQADAILDLRLRQLARLEETRIKGEQDALNAERVNLEKIINSKARLKTLVKQELKADAEKYGDARKSALVEAEEAQAFTEKELVSTEPVTLVLSEKGWVRAAKGHDIIAEDLSYRAGDGLLAAVQARASQDAVFLDSTGRAYTAAVHTLPSARGQGEPLTGRFNPPAGADFAGVAVGDKTARFVVASDAGYGFVVSLADMLTKNRSGKTLLSLPKGAKPIAPAAVGDPESDWLAAFSSAGHLLVFKVSELPALARGKGVKLLNIPKAKAADRSELMLHICVFADGGSVQVQSGKRTLNLAPSDLQAYQGERARRGLKLPKGFQKVDSLQVLSH